MQKFLWDKGQQTTVYRSNSNHCLFLYYLQAKNSFYTCTFITDLMTGNTKLKPQLGEMLPQEKEFLLLVSKTILQKKSPILHFEFCQLKIHGNLFYYLSTYTIS